MAIDRLENEHTVTIAICTYGRPDQVNNTIDIICQILKTQSLSLPVLIIDNNRGVETKNALKSNILKNKNFKYVQEKTIGLSYARNRAVDECRTEYIAFIDDDAYPSDDYFNVLIQMCKKGFDVAGGGQIPYSDLKLPIWYSKIHENQSFKDFASGFNIAFKVTSLKDVGLFDSKLGMKGKETGYGEEILPQLRIKNKGGKYIYNKHLLVHHYIQPYKLTKKWQLISSYSHGRDSWKLFDKTKLGFLDILYLFKELIIKHLSFSRDLTKQKSLAFEFGRLIGGFKHIR